MENCIFCDKIISLLNERTMVLDKTKWTTMSVEYDVKEMLDNFLVTVQGVRVKSAGDKLRYLLNYYEMNEKKK